MAAHHSPFMQKIILHASCTNLQDEVLVVVVHVHREELALLAKLRVVVGVGTPVCWLEKERKEEGD